VIIGAGETLISKLSTLLKSTLDTVLDLDPEDSTFIECTLGLTNIVAYPFASVLMCSVKPSEVDGINEALAVGLDS